MADKTEPGNTEKPVEKPVVYSKKLHGQICDYLREGLSVREISLLPGMPSKSTYFKWRNKKKPFRDDCHQAKIDGCFALIDEAKDIADDSKFDWKEVVQDDGSIKKVIDREVVARSKLRMDFRLTLASKLLPKIFGDKIEIEHKADESLAAIIKAARIRVHNRQ